VIDEANEKVVGIIALGDPVFNLRARDKWIGWSSADREARLCNVMDAYILGAVPPYSHLIGGKLVAALVASREVNRAFRAKYAGRRGLISGEVKDPKLVLVTTTSALGRSSIYNRLKVNGELLYRPIGYTCGWGHFHIPEGLFADMKRLLELVEHPYARGYNYGQGPNWRLRVIRQALQEVGLGGHLLNHGVRRQVFAVPLARNFRQYLCGNAQRARWHVLPAADIAEFCVNRWMVPRSKRDERFRSVTRRETVLKIVNNGH